MLRKFYEIPADRGARRLVAIIKMFLCSHCFVCYSHFCTSTRCIPALRGLRQMATGSAALEAARAATMSVHAAAGVASSTSRQAARLLRAAEGLCRTASVLLATPLPQPLVSSTPGVDAAAAPRRRRRPRGKRREGARAVDVAMEIVEGKGKNVVEEEETCTSARSSQGASVGLACVAATPEAGGTVMPRFVPGPAEIQTSVQAGELLVAAATSGGSRMRSSKPAISRRRACMGPLFGEPHLCPGCLAVS